jgi:hypothetical protein
LIDHRGDCNAQPCTCGAKARAATRRYHREHPEMAKSQIIQQPILAERLGIAGDEDE